MRMISSMRSPPGAAAVVVERVPPGLSVPAIVVPDTRAALGQIAHGWRAQRQIPVIGVTGSNGKTTVKEMIAASSRPPSAKTAPGHARQPEQRHRRAADAVPPARATPGGGHRDGHEPSGRDRRAGAHRCADASLVNNAQREHQEFMPAWKRWRAKMAP
jgi:UDP-N-acetylmuramoyl-tripeptide--D-alanyl-D-alanine ligase